MEVSLSLSLSGAGAVTSLYGEPRQHLRRFELGRTTKLSSSRSSNLHSLSFNSTPSRFTTWVSATGKESEDNLAQNFGEEEDTDEMFDSLFEKYGKVVFQSNDKKSRSDEIDDDSESLSFAVAVAKVASDVKAGDIKVLFVKPLVYWTRFFIITTAFSRPQIDAIRFRVKDLAEKEYGRVSTGDTKPNSWTLLDFGDVVFHIFLPEQREYYNLEEFYANATLVDLPFDKQPPYQR